MVVVVFDSNAVNLSDVTQAVIMFTDEFIY